MGAGLDALGVGRNDSVLDVTEGVVRNVRAVVNADVEAVEAAEAGGSLSGVLARSRSTDVKLIQDHLYQRSVRKWNSPSVLVRDGRGGGAFVTSFSLGFLPANGLPGSSTTSCELRFLRSFRLLSTTTSRSSS